MRKCWSKPFVDGCDQHGGFVADGEFVVPRCHCAMSLEAVDAALDRVALFVVFPVELRWSASAGAEVLAVADLVRLLRDGAGDPASVQVGAVGAGSVGLVAPDLVRSGSRPSGAWAGYSDLLQDRAEVGTVVPVAGGDEQRQWFLSLLGGEVDLRSQTAAGTSEGVVVGLGDEAAGRFLLKVPFLRAPAAC